MNTYTPPLTWAVTSIYLTTSKEAKGCEQWDSQTTHMEDTKSRLPKWRCLSHGNTSFFWPTSLILFCPELKPPNPFFPKTAQYFPSLDFQSFNPPLFKPVPPRNISVPTNATSSPRRAQTALLFPPLCPQLPSLQQLHMTEPILLSWFSMERKSLCFEGCFKNSPRHIQYLFRRGKKKNQNNNKCISDTDKKLFLRFPGYLLMEECDVLHIFIPPTETQDISPKYTG